MIMRAVVLLGLIPTLANAEPSFAIRTFTKKDGTKAPACIDLTASDIQQHTRLGSWEFPAVETLTAEDVHWLEDMVAVAKARRKSEPVPPKRAIEGLSRLPEAPRRSMPHLGENEIDIQMYGSMACPVSHGLMWWDTWRVVPLPYEHRKTEKRYEWAVEQLERAMKVRNDYRYEDNIVGLAEFMTEHYADRADYLILIDYDVSPENIARQVSNGRIVMLSTTVVDKYGTWGPFIAVIDAQPDGAITFIHRGEVLRGQIGENLFAKDQAAGRSDIFRLSPRRRLDPQQRTITVGNLAELTSDLREREPTFTIGYDESDRLQPMVTLQCFPFAEIDVPAVAPFDPAILSDENPKRTAAVEPIAKVDDKEELYLVPEFEKPLPPVTRIWERHADGRQVQGTIEQAESSKVSLKVGSRTFEMSTKDLTAIDRLAIDFWHGDRGIIGHQERGVASYRYSSDDGFTADFDIKFVGDEFLVVIPAAQLVIYGNAATENINIVGTDFARASKMSDKYSSPKVITSTAQREQFITGLQTLGWGTATDLPHRVISGRGLHPADGISNAECHFARIAIPSWNKAFGVFCQFAAGEMPLPASGALDRDKLVGPRATCRWLEQMRAVPLHLSYTSNDAEGKRRNYMIALVGYNDDGKDINVAPYRLK